MLYRPHRYLTDYRVTLRTPAGQKTAHILDVNNGGACLSGIGGLARGDKVWLDVLSHHIEAIVLWAKGDQIGVSFRPAISDRFLDTIRKRVDPRGGLAVRHFGSFREMR